MRAATAIGLRKRDAAEEIQTGQYAPGCYTNSNTVPYYVPIGHHVLAFNSYNESHRDCGYGGYHCLCRDPSATRGNLPEMDVRSATIFG